MKKGTKAHLYTDAQKQFLKVNCKGISHTALRDLFNNQFELDLTLLQIKSSLKRYGLSSGIDCRFSKGHIPANKGQKGVRMSPKTEFKPGHVPANYMPVGSERVNTMGYIDIKVADPNKWKAKHKIVWETVKGPIPKGHVLLFADRDKLNISIENLLLVSRRELAVMNHEGLIHDDPELTKAGKNIAALKIKVRDRTARSKES